MRQTLIKICPTCGTEFETTNPRKQYCTPLCRPSIQRTNAFYKDIKIALPSGTVGACGELLAAHDLLLRGFFVFRSMTPNSPVDLLILNAQDIYTVEVKTGYKRANGTMTCTSHPHDCDILAICDQHKRTIHYKGINRALPENLESAKSPRREQNSGKTGKGTLP
jgi:hypothetical protein